MIYPKRMLTCSIESSALKYKHVLGNLNPTVGRNSGTPLPSRGAKEGPGSGKAKRKPRSRRNPTRALPNISFTVTVLSIISAKRVRQLSSAREQYYTIRSNTNCAFQNRSGNGWAYFLRLVVRRRPSQYLGYTQRGAKGEPLSRRIPSIRPPPHAKEKYPFWCGVLYRLWLPMRHRTIVVSGAAFHGASFSFMV